MKALSRAQTPAVRRSLVAPWQNPRQTRECTPAKPLTWTYALQTVDYCLALLIVLDLRDQVLGAEVAQPAKRFFGV